MGLKRERSQFHLRRGRGLQLLERARHRPRLSGAPGSVGRLLILRKETAGNCVQCSQLLRVVLELRSGDERGLVSDVFLSNSQIF